jgi:hypothetical protein
MPVGFRVYTHLVRPDPVLLKRFSALRTPDISDAMKRANTMDNGIQSAYFPAKRVHRAGRHRLGADWGIREQGCECIGK